VDYKEPTDEIEEALPDDKSFGDEDGASEESEESSESEEHSKKARRMIEARVERKRLRSEIDYLSDDDTEEESDVESEDE